MLLDLSTQGFRPTEIVPRVMDATGFPESTVWYHWGRRNQWIPILLNMDHEKTTQAIQNLLAGYRVHQAESLRTFRRTDNPNAKVGALREYRDSLSDEWAFRQSLGMMPKVAVKTETTLEVLHGDRIGELLATYAKAQSEDLEEIESDLNALGFVFSDSDRELLDTEEPQKPDS